MQHDTTTRGVGFLREQHRGRLGLAALAFAVRGAGARAKHPASTIPAPRDQGSDDAVHVCARVSHVAFYFRTDGTRGRERTKDCDEKRDAGLATLAGRLPGKRGKRDSRRVDRRQRWCLMFIS